MKRKVKRYDEGGILTDRYGNPVKSGSGETVKTRYGSSTPKEDRPTSSGVEDYASMGKRAGATSPFSGPKEYISESIKEDIDMPKMSSSDEESAAGKGARNLALEEPETKVKVKKKTVIDKKPYKYEDTGAKVGSQNFKIGEDSKTLPGKLSDKEEKPQTLPGKKNAKEYYRDFSGKIKEKTPDTNSFKDFGEMISRGTGALGRRLSDYASKNIKSPAQRRDEEKASKGYAKGGRTSTASSRGDGIAQRGKTKGRIC